jgi:hypothetical protein
MNKNVTGTFGFILLLAAVALPFLGLEQSKGDVLPLLVAFLTVLASGAFFILALRPIYVKRYLIGVLSLIMVLMAIGVAGYFHHSAPQGMTQH